MHPSPKEHPLYRQLIRQIKANDIQLRTPKRGVSVAEEKAQYQRLERQQDLLYEQLKFWDELEIRYKYDPNQPRVPAGIPDGGQWTDGDGGINPVVTGATLAQSASKPGNNSWIGRAEQIGRQIDRDIPLRAIVRSNPVIRSAASLLSFLKAPELEYPLAEAVQQYNAVAAAEDPYVVPILSLRAKQFTKGDSDANVWASVREVDKDTIAQYCSRYFDVQTQTDIAAYNAGPVSNYLNRAAYGTAVHTLLANQINMLPLGLTAELYLRRPLEGAADEYYRGHVKPHEEDSVGLDVLEEVSDEIACIYDIKTGRRGLSNRRMEEFSMSLDRRPRKFKHYFVIEVRPSAGSVIEK